MHSIQLVGCGGATWDSCRRDAPNSSSKLCAVNDYCCCAEARALARQSSWPRVGCQRMSSVTRCTGAFGNARQRS